MGRVLLGMDRAGGAQLVKYFLQGIKYNTFEGAGGVDEDGVTESLFKQMGFQPPASSRTTYEPFLQAYTKMHRLVAEAGMVMEQIMISSAPWEEQNRAREVSNFLQGELAGFRACFPS